MKGIAIILVIIGHYFLAIPWLPTIIWSFHMPLFVFLNGYFQKQIPLGERLRKSFKAYLLPYLLTWGVLLLAEFLLTIKGGDIIDIIKTRIISGFYGLASNNTVNRPEFVIKIGAIWFLNALFWGNIFMGFILKI